MAQSTRVYLWFSVQSLVCYSDPIPIFWLDPDTLLAPFTQPVFTLTLTTPQVSKPRGHSRRGLWRLIILSASDQRSSLASALNCLIWETKKKTTTKQEEKDHLFSDVFVETRDGDVLCREEFIWYDLPLERGPWASCEWVFLCMYLIRKWKGWVWVC